MNEFLTPKNENSSSCPNRTLPLPQNNNHNHVSSIGKTATNELWDMIYNSPRNHRFTDAQRNRKLSHPSLPQPSPEEESQSLAHHKMSPSFDNTSDIDVTNDYEYGEKKSHSESDLHARLVAALERSGSKAHLLHNNNDDYSSDDYQSPTSTLNFPGPPPPPPGNNDFCKPLPSSHSRNNIQQINSLVLPKKHASENNITRLGVSTSAATHDMNNNNSELKAHSPCHSFVVCADTQLGMTSINSEWETELEYSRQAVNYINSLPQRPSFVCVCGDLVDMEYSFYEYNEHSSDAKRLTKRKCLEIQDEQNRDWKKVWSQLDDRIPLVCMCGNHDVGNRPTRASINRFRSAYGDDYLSFWTNGCFNIILNSCLFSDKSGAPDLYAEQVAWLKETLAYAKAHDADQIFVFSHHPWFLYDENESNEDLKGIIPFPDEWKKNNNFNNNNDDDDDNYDEKTNQQMRGGFEESYFPIDIKERRVALKLFQDYGVSACFSGHFHQNLLSKTSWGMDMIVTAPLSIVFDSPSTKPMQWEENDRGIRIVTVEGKQRFTHRFEPL